MKENDFLTINTYESEENIHIEFRHRLREHKHNESEILFLPFDETSQNLGLPLCYRLLKYMDGLLSFVQEQDEIIFTVSLPKRGEREFVSSPSNEPPKS
jgi:hypothetical protein